MKKISDILPNSDAYKQLKKRGHTIKKETSINEQVNTIKSLSDEIFESQSTKFYQPVWFEIQKDDNPDIWDAHLDALGIETHPDCDTVILKVQAYVECQPPIRASNY